MRYCALIGILQRTYGIRQTAAYTPFIIWRNWRTRLNPSRRRVVSNRRESSGASDSPCDNYPLTPRKDCKMKIKTCLTQSVTGANQTSNCSDQNSDDAAHRSVLTDPIRPRPKRPPPLRRSSVTGERVE